MEFLSRLATNEKRALATCGGSPADCGESLEEPQPGNAAAIDRTHNAKWLLMAAPGGQNTVGGEAGALAKYQLTILVDASAPTASFEHLAQPSPAHAARVGGEPNLPRLAEHVLQRHCAE